MQKGRGKGDSLIDSKVSSDALDMGELVVETSSEEETKDLGSVIGRILQRGESLFVHGDLGSGKTVLIKGVAEAFGINEREVTSASFVIVAEHYGRIPFYHIDLYRLAPEHVEDLALEEYIEGDGVCAVEWADRLPRSDCTVEVHISYVDPQKRRIVIKADEKKLSELKKLWNLRG